MQKVIGKDIKKKTWTIYFVYVLPGIAKHLTHYIRVKAHARTDVSILAFTLACSCLFWRNFDEQDSSGRFNFYNVLKFSYVIGDKS